METLMRIARFAGGMIAGALLLFVPVFLAGVISGAIVKAFMLGWSLW